MTDKPWLPALPLADLVPGAMRCVTVGEQPVLVVRGKDGAVHALHNICTHAYAKLDEGRLRGHRLICPLHGASFDVRDGSVLGAPATQALVTFPVRVVDELVEVQL